jgi:hypothetical protein
MSSIIGIIRIICSTLFTTESCFCIYITVVNTIKGALLFHVLFGTRSQATEDEMSRACSVHRGDEKCVQNFGSKV